jgi:hypothetical protein
VLKNPQSYTTTPNPQPLLANPAALEIRQQNPSTSKGDAVSTSTPPGTSHISGATPLLDREKNIDCLAFDFAKKLPEYVFSPAEIQGFLLTRKKEPQRAVEEVARWCDDVLSGRDKSFGSAGAGGTGAR